MKSFAKICLALITAVTLAATTGHAQTDSTSGTNKAASVPPKPKAKRYAGKIDSVDKDAKTVTITSARSGSQTLHITSKTRIMKDGEPATLEDAAAGLRASGSERQDDSGNWVATTLNIGQTKKPAAPAAPSTTPPADKPADKQ